MNKSRSKIVSKFGQKMLEYWIIFKNILTLLGLDYRDASLITLYFVVPGISISNQSDYHIAKNLFGIKKVKNQHL